MDSKRIAIGCLLYIVLWYVIALFTMAFAQLIDDTWGVF